ncbi:Carbonic anhydrase 2 [Orchesella cincta]|uniref:carbonic anhydrase n=1 Tax=Orchesella cincta TaxID=48709 RepID=A0A1D2MMI6_ORCCI|nr:Carbonic anhydrase 2 [Orchesella cincta]
MAFNTGIIVLILINNFFAGPTLAQVFCYSDGSCGPATPLWGGACQTGSRQSPIDLPYFPLSVLAPPIVLNLKNYRGSSFRMQNNGHTVQVDFNGAGPSAAPRPFPDPITRNKEIRQYIFASAHFHWGRSDFNGSEHCIQGKCTAMELHLVHYQSKFASQSDAVASGDPDALAVIGVLIEKSGTMSILNGAGLKSDALSPIVRNLPRVAVADEVIQVNEALDLTPLLKDTHGLVKLPVQVYTYKGSLTTPGCNEQVNWYVMRRPALTTMNDVLRFRSLPRDEGGEVLSENHRPRQALNGRQVKLSVVI